MTETRRKPEPFDYKILDNIRTLMENAQEEYRQELEAFEAEFGPELREEYEERYV